MNTIFDMQKQMMGEWEKNLTTWFDGILRDPAWLKLMSSQLNSSLDFQKQMQQGMEPMLKNMGVMTPAEQKGLFETVANLNRRVMDLEEKLEEAELQAKNGKKKRESK